MLNMKSGKSGKDAQALMNRLKAKFVYHSVGALSAINLQIHLKRKEIAVVMQRCKFLTKSNHQISKVL